MKRKVIFLAAAISALAISAVALSSKVPQQDQRPIKKLHKPQRNDIGNLVTYNVMPSGSVSIDQLDPFLFLNHHGPQEYPPNNNGLPFGPHPHKGFETVTFILEGELLHKDNSGHESVIGAGGVQWMRAGKGIVHAEVSSEEFKQQGGEVEILQLWINLPSKHKNVEPSYTGLQQEEIPSVSVDKDRVNLHLVAGSWNGKNGPLESLTGAFMSWLNMRQGGQADLSVNPSREVFFYVVSGKVSVNGRSVEKMTLLEFENQGSTIEVEADEDAVVLFGHAAPTDEPVVARGPFVMNSQEEIEQAYKDYRAGKFGRSIID